MYILQVLRSISTGNPAKVSHFILSFIFTIFVRKKKILTCPLLQEKKMNEGCVFKTRFYFCQGGTRAMSEEMYPRFKFKRFS